MSKRAGRTHEGMALLIGKGVKARTANWVCVYSGAPRVTTK